jgi:hypothetical protein
MNLGRMHDSLVIKTAMYWDSWHRLEWRCVFIVDDVWLVLFHFIALIDRFPTQLQTSICIIIFFAFIKFWANSTVHAWSICKVIIILNYKYIFKLFHFRLLTPYLMYTTIVGLGEYKGEDSPLLRLGSF